MINEWVAPYIGLPFLDGGRNRYGLDCWGIVYLVEREHFGNEFPSFTGFSRCTTEHGELAQIVFGGAKTFCEKVTDPREGDVVLFIVGGYPLHIGVVLDDTYMLHCKHGANSNYESYRASKWATRIEGFYRFTGPSLA